MEKPAAQIHQTDTKIRHDLIKLYVNPIDILFALKTNHSFSYLRSLCKSLPQSDSIDLIWRRHRAISLESDLRILTFAIGVVTTYLLSKPSISSQQSDQ